MQRVVSPVKVFASCFWNLHKHSLAHATALKFDLKPLVGASGFPSNARIYVVNHGNGRGLIN